jgi:hypothetical protein
MANFKAAEKVLGRKVAFDARTFGEAKCPQCGQMIPVTYADGALYFIGHAKKDEPFKCTGSHRLAGKAGTNDSTKRARLHRALDAVMDGAGKDTITSSDKWPGPLRQEAFALRGKAYAAVTKAKDDAYRLGGDDYGASIWKMIKETISNVM